MPGRTQGIHTEQQILDLWGSDSAAALNEYLTLMEESEAPRAYLVWSLIAAAAGLLGKNAAFHRGTNHVVTPNLFIVLLGPAALKKSTAVNLIVKQLKETTLNFGPTDTGGQRQGLMSALTGLHRVNRHAYRNGSESPLSPLMLNPRSSADIFLAAPELGRLFGTGSQDMANFMADLWDGQDIDYQTKAGETKVIGPLATLLGATTPSNLANMLPENAIGHGILSRIVFVFEDKIHKSVPLPPVPTEEWWEERAQFLSRLYWIDENRMQFSISKEAESLYEDVLYHYYPQLDDPRLESYRGRRPTILLKVAMAVTALRNDSTITIDDLRLAHELLHSAEPNMHRALEYFGRNRIFQGRMLIIQFLRAAGRTASASMDELLAAAASELNRREAQEALDSMLASGELYKFGDSIILGELKNELLANRDAKKKSEPKNKGAGE